MPAISISTNTRSGIGAAQVRYVVAVGALELTAAQLWVLTLSGDQSARAALLARVMPQPRNN
jgi:hypothetical protein